MVEVQVNNKTRLLFIGYLGFLILMAILPLNGESSILSHTFVVRIRLDYLLHSILFIPWALLYIIAFKPSSLKAKLIMIVTGLLVAFATEGVQYFLSYRAYNINDLLANWLGVILGSVVLLVNLNQLKIKN